MDQPFCACSPGEILARFGTSTDTGLSETQVQKLLEQYGPNVLPEKKKSRLKIYFAPLLNLMTLILFAAAGVNLILFLAYEQNTVGSAILIFAVVFLNFLMSLFQTFRAQRALAALKKLTAFQVTVMRGGQKTRIDSSELVCGDLLSLTLGDYIGADARVISAAEFKVDESMLTGESMPVKKVSAALPSCSLTIQEQENMIFMGTFVVAGEATAVVVATGFGTQIGKIAETLQVPEGKQVPLQRKMNALALGLGVMVLIAIGVMLAFNFISLSLSSQLTPDEVANGIELAAALAVAAIPVNFPIMTTLILLRGVIALARSKVIVRKLDAIESLGRISVVCSDKTGTITKNEMTIQNLVTYSGVFEVTGLGYAPEGQILANGSPIDLKQHPLLEMLIKAGVVSNSADMTTEQKKLHKQKRPATFYKIIGEPTEGAFLVLAAKVGYNLKEIRAQYPVPKSFPFSSERKRSSVIAVHDNQVMVFVKGAAEVVTARCTQIWGDAGPIPLTEEIAAQVNAATRQLASRAMRTLAVAWKIVDGGTYDIPEEYAESNLTLLGIVGIVDPPREGVKEAVQSCQNAGIKVVMITGDHPDTAAAIASDLGIYSPSRDLVMAGAEIASAPPEKVVQATVFSRVNPQDKQLIVKNFQTAGKIVAMTGDGVNDALALEKADAGVAMGISGTDVAKNAADFILGDDSFATIEQGVFQGRGIFKNIRSCILYLLTGNLAELLLLFFAQLLFQIEFFLPFQLYYFYVTVHFFPVLALMFDKMDREELMNKPPKDAKEGIITRELLLMLLIQVIIVAGFVALAFMWGRSVVLPENTPEFAEFPLNIEGDIIDLNEWHGRTVALLTLVISESVIAFNVRSERQSIARSGFNFFLLFFVGFTIVTAYLLTYLTLGQQWIYVTRLSAVDWVMAITLSAPAIILVELYKKFLRSKYMLAFPYNVGHEFRDQDVEIPLKN